MAIRVVPCGFEPDLSLCRQGPCCPDVTDEANAVIAQLALDVATNLLWGLTGRAYGCCPVTVRPCRPTTCEPTSLADRIYWDARRSDNLGVMSYTPTLVGGEVYNLACGACPVGCCTCAPTCHVLLSGPVCAVTEVIVGGLVLDPEDYYLLDHGVLAFRNGICPPCQDFDLAAGEEGTWSVTYTTGIPVPVELNLAVGLYACELAKLLLGEPCGLPSRVQSIARDGIDVAFVDPRILAQEGLTGIPFCDIVIKSLNPNKMAEPSRVWTPQLAKQMRRQT